MSEVSTYLARSEADFEDARQICLTWLDWHWRNYPPDWPQGPDHPMNPESFRAVIRDLPAHHKRPLGGIILGSVAGKVAGCVMYHEAQPGLAEFKRMFVTEAGRGQGLGRKLLDAMFKQMVTDGYRKVFFSSAVFLTHARRMYEDAGFRPIPTPAELPDEWRERIYFMERDLP